MNCVFPVRFVSEGVSAQTTSRELTPQSIAVRSLAPPHEGARVSMALYLPNAGTPVMAIGRVVRAQSDAPAESGFRADFVVVDPQVRTRISKLLADRDEHRVCQRAPVKLKVRFRGAGEFVQAHAIDISRSGFFIHCDDPPAVNTAVQVEVQLPDSGRPVTSRGIVVRRQRRQLPGSGKPVGVGVQFVDAGDEFRERIDRCMEDLLKT